MRAGLIRAWLIGTVALLAGQAAAEPPIHARLEALARTYDVHPDLTYVETLTVDFRLLTARGIHDHERGTMTFYPASQALEVLEAWVEQPDGSRIDVPEASRFTRPAEAAQNAPGFTGAMTTTLLYPQLRPGSRTHVRWRLTQKTPGLLGFNVWAEPPLDIPVSVGEVTVRAPAALPLHWAARGGFEATDTAEAGLRTITARIANTRAEEAERDMVATADFQPLFLVTSLARLEDIGAQYYRQSHAKVVVTPEISELAARLAGGRTDEEAARRIYNWVTTNIRYVAVYLDPNDGWVPHRADEVLRAGYGDCKDHVVLMQALLASIGIRAEAAMVDWGTRTREAPLWVPQFNHALVYLPQFDRYLNPTNPYAQYGSLDVRLAGKRVLLATPEGAIGHTPATRPEDNLYRMDSRETLLADGTVQGVATFAMAAAPESTVRGFVAQAASPEDLANRMLAATPEGGFGVLQSNDPRDLTQPLSLVATWRSPRALPFEGTQAFLHTPVGPDLDPVGHLRHLLSDGPRRHAVIAGACDYQWSATLTVPADAGVTRMPDDVALRNGAGSYTAHYERQGQAVRVIRRLVIDRDVYEAAEYPDLEALLYAPIQDARATFVASRVETLAASP